MEGIKQETIEREPVDAEIIEEVTDEVLEAAQKYTPEIRSINQVPITKEWLERIVNSDSTFLLTAKEEGKIIGLAVLVVYPTLINPRALLETLVVDPESRRKGAGRKLLVKAIEEARNRKVNTLRLATGKENVASNALFKEMGGELSEDYNWYVI
jgi:ribosomal protein S18 acetylase RimI-like enzyme